MKPCLCLLLIAATAPLSAFALTPQADIIVDVDMTEAGRKVTRPTPEHPAYYAPVVGGFHEEGAVTAGTPPPPQNVLLHQMAVALAGQGYIVANATTPPPTVLLVFHWGSMNADITDTGDPDDPDQVFQNEKRMTALVAGQTLANLNPFTEKSDVRNAARVDRYFVMVSAYDYAAAKQKRKIALWRAKMSMPSVGCLLADVAPLLITSGAPLLGRETLRPVQITKPLAPEGHVNLGEMQVKEYIEPTAPPADKPKQP